MIEPKDIIKKGQMDNFKKVISRIEKEARRQAIEDEIKFLESFESKINQNISEIIMAKGLLELKVRIRKLKKELDKNG